MNKNKLAIVASSIMFCMVGYLIKSISVSTPSGVANPKPHELNRYIEKRSNLSSTKTCGDDSRRWVLGRELKSDLTLDEARQLLEEFNASHSDMESRDRLVAEIMMKLCLNGNTHDAWELINPSYGSARKTGLRGFFAAAKLETPELLDMLKKCDTKGDMSAALSGLFPRLKPLELANLVKSPQYKEVLERAKKTGDPINESSNLSSSLQLALAFNKATTEEVMQAAMALNSNGTLRSEDVMIIAKYDDPKNAFQNWDLLKSLAPTGAEENEGLRIKRDALISNMIALDAARTLTTLITGEAPEQTRDIWAAIGRWNRADAQGAADWYAKNSSSLSPKQQVVVAGSFASEAFQAGEIDGARMWANQIQDPEARASALKKIDSLVNPPKNPEAAPN